jgi:acyl-CoA synthetase (AMP-forming)/AMP-acid ligase II
LRGRAREEINKGGQKIYPGDIDSVIERFDETVDVCSFGFSDPLHGEDVGVAVILQSSSQDAQDTLDALVRLHRWAAKHLAVHQMPQRWYLVINLVLWIEAKTGHAIDPTSVDIAQEWDSVADILRYLRRTLDASVSGAARCSRAARSPLPQSGYRIVRYDPSFKHAVAQFQTGLWSPDPELNRRYSSGSMRAIPIPMRRIFIWRFITMNWSA